jgi:hypothetical protein
MPTWKFVNSSHDVVRFDIGGRHVPIVQREYVRNRTAWIIFNRQRHGIRGEFLTRDPELAEAIIKANIPSVSLVGVVDDEPVQPTTGPLERPLDPEQVESGVQS